MSAPDFRTRCDFPEDLEPAAIFEAWIGMAKEAEAQGMTHVRMTAVNDEFPEGLTPHGMYLEGWKVPPAEQPAFVWPADA